MSERKRKREREREREREKSTSQIENLKKEMSVFIRQLNWGSVERE